MTSANIDGARPRSFFGGRAKGPRGPQVPAFAFMATAPTFLLVLLIVGFPLGYSIWLAVHRSNPITKKNTFVGTDNFAAVLADPAVWASIARTCYFAAFAIIGTTLIGLGMALLLNRVFPGRGLLRSIVLVPWAMAPISIGVLWSFIYAGNIGSLNGLLFDLGLGGLATAWLGDGTRALNLVALTHVWNQAPLTALILLAGLQSMPASLQKAAMLDGAGAWSRFVKITLPWLKPSLLFATIIATINALMAFDIVWIMTRGGPGEATTVLAWIGYVTSFQFLRFGEGAAILYLLTALSFALAVLYVLVLGPRARKATVASQSVSDEAFTTSTRRAHHVMATIPRPPLRKGLSPKTQRLLGRVGLFIGALVILVWSAAPVLQLLLMSVTPASDLIRTPPSVIPTGFTLDNFRAVLLPQAGADQTMSVQARRVPLSLMNSTIVGVSVVVVTLLLAPFAGYVFARYPRATAFRVGLWGLLLTRMVPALTLVLPFFVIYRGLGLIDSRTGLVIAQLSILLPLTAWMMKSTFESVPISLDRAAMIDGCSRFTMMWKVLLPVVRPGLVAAAIFGFLVSWNEFLFAMILTSTPHSQTIPVVLSGFMQQARFYEYGPMFAASVLSVLPPVVIAFVFQRYLIQGALAGAVKG